MATLDVALFGLPRAERDGVSLSFQRHRTFALLAYLAATNRPHRRDTLAALFWPDLDEPGAHAALRRDLYDLSRTIGKEWLDVEHERVALRPQEGLRVDVRCFSELVTGVAGHGHATGQLCDECLSALAEAAGLYCGDFLAGFSLRGSAEFDDWQSFTTESLRLELAGVLEKLATGLAGRRQYHLALPHARRWLALDPLDEASHRLLMQLHAWTGDRAAAARQYAQCAQVLAAELSIEPAAETTALYRNLVRAAPSAAPAADVLTGTAPSHNLPTDTTAFIGRTEALSRAAERLADPACRLLTVLGPGGIGKTRLAVRAARGEVGRFAQGIYFVDLASLPSAELLSSAILHSLDVPRPAAREPDELLLELVKDRQMLLLLDNYEHLLTGGEPDRRDGYGLVTKLIGAAPQLKLLVTSRSRLNVPAEWLLPLEGLAAPPAEAEGDLSQLLTEAGADEVGNPGVEVPAGYAPGPEGPAEASNPEEGARATVLGDYSAAVLFLESVRRVRPGFRPSAAEADPCTGAIARICRLLDGVPLAIELAAAWARVLPLDEIVCRLERGMELLTTTLRGVPARQRSMAATFDYSWQLLAPQEQSILRQLAVFRGGFTAEAAEAVAGASPADLATLIDASWLRLVESGRYAVHELVRQYCAEKLECEHLAEASETADEVRRRHVAYYHALLAKRWTAYFRRVGVMDELVVDLDNLWAALDWALAQEDAQTAWGLYLGLSLVADRQGLNAMMVHYLEASAARLTAVLAETPPYSTRYRQRTLLIALLRCVCQEHLSRLGRIAEAAACFDDAKILLEARDEGAPWAEMGWFYRRGLAWTRVVQNDFAGAAQLFRDLADEALAERISIWPYTTDMTKGWAIEVGAGLADCLVALGDYSEGLRLARTYIAVAEARGEELMRAIAARPYVWALLKTGAYGQAEREARRFLVATTAFKDTLFTVQALLAMGWVQYDLGRYERARTIWRRGVTLSRRLGLALMCVECLIGLGYAELALDNRQAARQLFIESQGGFDSSNPAASSGSLLGLAWVALRQDQLTEALALLRQVLARPRRHAVLTASALRCLAEAAFWAGERMRPAELCGFLLSWHGTPHDIIETSKRLLAHLEAAMSPADLAAALERGRLLGPEEAARALDMAPAAGSSSVSV